MQKIAHHTSLKVEMQLVRCIGKYTKTTYLECSRLIAGQYSWFEQFGMVLTTWQQKQILKETGEHMPRLEMYERSKEIEPIGGGKRNNNLPERLVRFHEAGTPRVS